MGWKKVIVPALFALTSGLLLLVGSCSNTEAGAKVTFSASHQGTTVVGSVYVLVDTKTGCQYLVINGGKAMVPRYEGSGSRYSTTQIVGCR